MLAGNILGINKNSLILLYKRNQTQNKTKAKKSVRNKDVNEIMFYYKSEFLFKCHLNFNTEAHMFYYYT